MEDFQTPKKPINVFEIAEGVKPALLLIKRRWWIILSISLFMGLFMFWSEKSKPTLYKATNTFLLEDEIMEELGGGNGGTNLLSILQGQNVAKGNKLVLVELALSYQIIEKTLLHGCYIGGKWQSLGERYLQLSGRLESLKSDKTLHGFKPDSTFKFGTNNKYDFLMRTLAMEIAPNIKATTRESGITEHVMTFWDEEFAKVFASYHIREISEYYTEKRLEKAAQLLAYTGRKMDSLESRLRGQEYGLAQLNDDGFGVVMARAKVPELNYKRNITLTSSQYMEAVTANNLARLEFEKRRPLITVVDDARLPLLKIEGNPMKSLITGAILGIFLGILGVGGFYFLNNMLAEQRKLYKLENTQRKIE